MGQNDQSTLQEMKCSMRIIEKCFPFLGCSNTFEGESPINEYQVSQICMYLMRSFWDIGSPPHRKSAKIYKKVFEGKILDVLANFNAFVISDADGSNFKNFYKLSVTIKNDEILYLELLYEGSIRNNPHKSWGVDIGSLEDIIRKEDERRHGFPKILPRMQWA